METGRHSQSSAEHKRTKQASRLRERLSMQPPLSRCALRA